MKTHFPERYGWREFGAQRALLLVRNPVNAIRSYFNMLLTGTHTHSIAPSEYSRFGEVWQQHVKEEVVFWLEYHRWWLSQPVPLRVVRYEDLADKVPGGARLPAMQRMCEFLHGETHTAFRAAATTAAAHGDASQSPPPLVLPPVRLDGFETAGEVYTPRAAAVGTDWTHFTPELQEFVLETLSQAPELERLGYRVVADDDESGGGGAGRRLEPVSNTEGEASWLDVLNAGAAPSNLVWCNTGVPMRPATEEDPHARGFQWKWRLRKVVRVEKKDGVVSQRAARLEEEKHVEGVALGGGGGGDGGQYE